MNYENNLYNIDNLVSADNNVFEIFTLPLVRGKPEYVLSDPNGIVLSESLAEKIFGTENPLAKQIKINNEYVYSVSGIMQDLPQNSHLVADAIVSSYHNRFCDILSTSNNVTGERTKWFQYMIYLSTELSATTEFEQKINQDYKENIFSREGLVENFTFQSINEIYLNNAVDDDRVKHGSPLKIKLLLAIATLTLFIACINYVNLTTGRSLIRAKEIGIKKTAGAFRAQLITQILFEAVFICFTAAIVAFIMARLFIPEFNKLIMIELSLNRFFSFPDLLYVFCGIFIIGILAGIYPALYLSGFHPITILRDKSLKSKKGILIRKGLIFVQFSISIILIITTMVIYKQFNYMSNKELGFDKDYLVHIKLNSVYPKAEVIKDKFLQNPNITHAALSNGTPVGGNINYTGWTKNNKSTEIAFFNITPEYIKTLKLQIVEGRNFRPTDEGKARLLNEAAKKLMELDKPEVKVKNKNVVGIVKDFHFESLHNKIAPLILSYHTEYFFDLTVRISSNSIFAAMNYMKSVWKEMCDGVPFDYEFYDQWIDSKYRAEEKLQQLTGYAAGFTILISCFGLIGLALFTAENRIKEIGIRKVIGASVTNILTMLSKDFIKLVLLANVLAWPVAHYFINKWLESFAYHTSISWWLYIVAGGVTFSIALITVSFTTFKTAKANPVDILKYE